MLDLLASWNVGWGPDSVQTVGERCVKTVTSALRYLDPHQVWIGVARGGVWQCDNWIGALQEEGYASRATARRRG